MHCEKCGTEHSAKMMCSDAAYIRTHPDPMFDMTTRRTAPPPPLRLISGGLLAIDDIGDCTLTDTYGNVWGLVETRLPDIPLTIELRFKHEVGCPVIADDESDMVLEDYQRCTCRP